MRDGRPKSTRHQDDEENELRSTTIEAAGYASVGSTHAARPATAPPKISEEEGIRLLGVVLGGCASTVGWQRARIVTLAAQRVSPTKISEVTAADPATVADVIDDFVRDGLDSLDPRYHGRR